MSSNGMGVLIPPSTVRSSNRYQCFASFKLLHMALTQFSNKSLVYTNKSLLSSTLHSLKMDCRQRSHTLDKHVCLTLLRFVQPSRILALQSALNETNFHYFVLCRVLLNFGCCFFLVAHSRTVALYLLFSCFLGIGRNCLPSFAAGFALFPESTSIQSDKTSMLAASFVNHTSQMKIVFSVHSFCRSFQLQDVCNDYGYL